MRLLSPGWSGLDSLDFEERRAKRFVEGLNSELRRKVMGYRCQTLSDVVDLTAWFEDDYK